MKIIDGKGEVMGRLASYAVKEALKGEEIAILNCDQVLISGNFKMIEADFLQKRQRGLYAQKGPYHHKTSEKIVKRAIRGMVPDHREGRGREAFKRIKCYNKVPKEFEGKDIIKFGSDKKGKYFKVKEFT